MDFLAEYASFLAKTVTLVVAILVVLISFAALRSKGRRKSAGQLQVSKLNDFYKGLRERLESTLLDKDQLKALRKSESKAEKKNSKKKPEAKPRVFVLDFDGDIKASATESLRHEITALLSLATPKDEVVLRLESGGGMVHSYGLASSQLARIRQAGVPLTVCIDKVAASGGYMMACSRWAGRRACWSSPRSPRTGSSRSTISIRSRSCPGWASCSPAMAPATSTWPRASVRSPVRCRVAARR